MGVVPRFTEVPASLEQVGGGALLWALGGLKSGLAGLRRGAPQGDSEEPTLGDRLDEAVRIALAPSAAPTMLLMLAIVVGLMRYAFIAAGADRMLQASLDGVRDVPPAPAPGKNSKAD